MYYCVQVGIASLGGALIVCALLANQRWLDRHFLPSFFLSRSSYVLVESVVRLGTAAFGLILALSARRASGLIANHPARALHIALAILLAICASELVLRRTLFLATMEEPPQKEPRRRRDPTLGWVFVPSRAGSRNMGGREIEYAIDASGSRVRRVAEPVDPQRPTVLFTGESIVVGEGLTWDESIPAQVSAILGVQSADLAVSGFANDQAYLKLQADLPRFRHPLAVVSLVMPAIFDRNLDDDRPHLGPGLIWFPAEPRWRLVRIAQFLLPYRSKSTIERGIVVTREVMRATIDLAHARGAMPLIIVLQFTPEAPVENDLRRRILDDAGLPYMWVLLDSAWRIPGNGHPDPRAARAIAVAISEGLRGQLKF
jgi:hypothetical protein